MTTTPYTPSTDDIVRAYAATRPGDPAEARAELNRWLTTQTVPVTDDLQERLWDAVTDVRDAHPRTKNDADSWDIVAAVLGVITGTIPASETDRTKES